MTLHELKPLLRKFLSEGDNLMYPEMAGLLDARLIAHNEDSGDYDITSLGRCLLDDNFGKLHPNKITLAELEAPPTPEELAILNGAPLIPMEIGRYDGVTFIESPKPSTLDTQVGGEHYKKLGQYQPWQVAAACMTPAELRGYMKGTVLAYLMREGDKGGDLDIEKAKHTIELWQEVRKDK